MKRQNYLFISLMPPVSDAADKALRERILAEIEQGHVITILTTTPGARVFSDLPVTIWSDGVPRGLLRLLELMRRVSWAQFSAVYDLDGSFRVRLYRWLVRPCPPWHREAAIQAPRDKAA